MPLQNMDSKVTVGFPILAVILPLFFQLPPHGAPRLSAPQGIYVAVSTASKIIPVNSMVSAKEPIKWFRIVNLNSSSTDF